MLKVDWDQAADPSRVVSFSVHLHLLYGQQVWRFIFSKALAEGSGFTM